MRSALQKQPSLAGNGELMKDAGRDVMTNQTAGRKDEPAHCQLTPHTYFIGYLKPSVSLFVSGLTSCDRPRLLLTCLSRLRPAKPTWSLCLLLTWILSLILDLLSLWIKWVALCWFVLIKAPSSEPSSVLVGCVWVQPPLLSNSSYHCCVSLKLFTDVQPVCVHARACVWDCIRLSAWCNMNSGLSFKGYGN